MATTQGHHHRGGLSTMAYILMFAVGTFSVIVTTFFLLARHPMQAVPVEPLAPPQTELPAQHG